MRSNIYKLAFQLLNNSILIESKHWILHSKYLSNSLKIENPMKDFFFSSENFKNYILINLMFLPLATMIENGQIINIKFIEIQKIFHVLSMFTSLLFLFNYIIAFFLLGWPWFMKEKKF